MRSIVKPAAAPSADAAEPARPVVAADDRDRRALGDERGGDGTPEPARRTEHERPAAVQPEVHQVPIQTVRDTRVEVHHRRAELLLVGAGAGLLDAAERGVERGADGRSVDAHHAGLDLGREALRGRHVARADRRRQPVSAPSWPTRSRRRDRRRARTRSPDRTPPRVASAVPGSTSTRIVGGKKLPRASSPSVAGAPPHTTVAPSAIAVATHRSIAATAAASISGPIVTPAASPGPSRYASASATTLSTSSSWTRAVDEDPAGARARLPGQREARAGDDRRGGVEVGVGEHDDRVLAAELELHAAAEADRGVDLADRWRSNP